MSAISVLLIDDNDLLAESLQRLIERSVKFSWAGWIGTPETAVSQVCELKPDLVLMDVDVPGVDTFALVREICEAARSVKVVMFSGHVNGEFADAAVDAGAYGYLHKDDEVQSLLQNLERAHEGEFVMSPLVQRMYLRAKG